MSEQKLYDHDKEVEELASYETTEVDVVPDMILHDDRCFANLEVLLVMNILKEERHQFVSLLLLVLDEPCCCSLAKELHESALHHDPEHPGQVEQDGEEQEVERHPLVVGVVHYGGGVHVLIKIISAISQSNKTQFHLITTRTCSFVFSANMNGGKIKH